MSSTLYTLAQVLYALAHISNLQTDVRKAPLHKLPFLSFSTGEKVPDSTLAYKYLIQHHLAPDIDADLTDLQKAQSNALQHWLENWIYFLWCWEKYVDNWHVTRDSLFAQFIPFYPFVCWSTTSSTEILCPCFTEWGLHDNPVR